MANSINYGNYPPVIHYMGYEYIGGEIKEAAKDEALVMVPYSLNSIASRIGMSGIAEVYDE